MLLTNVSGVIEKLKLTIYYEALCPDSKAFIVSELYPSYEILKNYIKIDFVPYGFAKVSFLQFDL